MNSQLVSDIRDSILNVLFDRVGDVVEKVYERVGARL